MNGRCLMTAMADSDTTRFWNLERAEGAVKGAFFAQEILAGESAVEPTLHYTEIRGLIKTNERAIGDRTLSKAIASLVAKRQLKKSGIGKGIVYTLDIPREERLRAFAHADTTWISRSAEVGGLGDGERGFAIYGVPEILRERYRRRLRKAALRHQGELRELVEEAWNEAEDCLLKPSRGRIPKKVWIIGERATRRTSRMLLIGTLGQGYASRLWQLLERTIPGALATYQRTLGISFAPETPLHERLTVAISKVAGVGQSEIRPEVDRLLKTLARDAERTQPLWEVLTQAEKERAGKQLAAAVAMTASLTSVVHA